MAYKINDKCVACGACASACPMGAISMGKDHFEIDTENCISCGCCEYTCPIKAPHMEEEN